MLSSESTTWGKQISPRNIRLVKCYPTKVQREISYIYKQYNLFHVIPMAPLCLDGVWICSSGRQSGAAAFLRSLHAYNLDVGMFVQYAVHPTVIYYSFHFQLDRYAVLLLIATAFFFYIVCI